MASTQSKSAKASATRSDGESARWIFGLLLLFAGIFLVACFRTNTFYGTRICHITGFCIEVRIDPSGSFAVDCLSISPEHHQAESSYSLIFQNR